MAICDWIIDSDIASHKCGTKFNRGVDSVGVIANRKDVTSWSVNSSMMVTLGLTHENAFKVIQGGKMPFNGTTQEMAEGSQVNTMTNTIQIIVLKHDPNFANQLDKLINGEFVVALANKNGTYQIYGLETGLHCTGAVRELYSDDNLAGWQLTFTEEGCAYPILFIARTKFMYLLIGTVPVPAPDDPEGE